MIVNHTKKVLIFYNPCAGGGKSISIISDIVIPIFHESDISTIVYPTKCEGDLTEYLQNESKQILSYKIDAFVVVGGDGTMHEFVNGYIFGNYKSYKIPVILVNGGSGNSLCLTINGFNDSDTKLRAYLKHIVSNMTDKNKNIIQWIDSIEFSQNNINKKNVLQYSASQSYFGIPSAVVHWANTNIFKSIFGASSLRYDLASVIEMSKHREYKLKFTFYGLQKQRDKDKEHGINQDEKKDDVDIDIDNDDNDKPFELIKTVEMFVAMKGKYFGKGIMISPFAKLDNGYLDILILERIETRLRLIGLFLKLQKVKDRLEILTEHGVLCYRCKQVLIEVLDEKDNIVTDKKKLKEMGLPDVGADGEFGPCLPLRLKAVPKEIPVLFPNPKLF